MILTLLVILTASLSWNVECETASQLIQQYSECKILTMMLTSDSYYGTYYIPNPTIPNNALNDTYYQSLGLGSMSFVQAMTFIKKIYREVTNCSTSFCNCVRWGPKGLALKYYEYFFLTEANFKGVKSILLDFNEKYSNQTQTLARSMLNTYNGQIYPTITSFLMKYDYSRNKLSYYLLNYEDCAAKDDFSRTVCNKQQQQ